MPIACSAVHSRDGVRLKRRPASMRAVYLIEAQTRTDAREVDMLFRELKSRVCVRPLSVGRLMSYAVEARSEDSPILDAVEDVLKESFPFVVVERVFDELTIRLVADLCRETGSRMYCLPRCNICGKPEPFPVETMGSGASAGRYCARCAADAWGL